MIRIFSLWTLQGLLAFAWLALLPSDSGLSPARLALLGVLLVKTGFSAAFGLAHSQHILATRFLVLRKFDPLLPFLCLLGLFAAPLAILALNALAVYDTGYFYSALATRLTPIAAWVSLSALEYLLFKLIKSGKLKAVANWPILIALVVLVVTGAFMMITRLGLTPLKDGSFGHPALPALEWHILLALGLALFGPHIIQGISSLLNTKRQTFNVERLTFFIIYFSTLALWLITPIQAGWFATPPRAPNFEIYPFSDALIYAQYVQSALAGYGFMWPEVPTRPFYIVLLTWLHALGGQEYSTVIALQTILLAAFPPALYLIGKEIGGKPLGLGLAVLAILRDISQNQAATFSYNYTYSKLYFSEIPAALLMTLSLWLAIRWVRQNASPGWLPILIGGLTGLSSLIRLQSAVLLAAVVIAAFFALPGRRKAWIQGTLLMALGLTLALTPWLVRNARAAGGLVFDNPISQTMVFARRWSGSAGNEALPKLPGENDAQYSSRMTRLALDSFRGEPGRILLGAANHFFNNQYALLLTFPLRDKLTNPAELLRPAHAFWQSEARFDGKNLVFVAFYALLAAIGIGAAWQRARWIGLLPLVLASLYNAWTALFLSSGDRFMVPIDWAGTLYLLLGLLTFINALAGRDAIPPQTQEIPPPHKPDSARDAIPRHANPRHPWRGLVLTAACILLLGLSLPLTEFAFPQAEPLNAPGLAPQGGEVIRSGRAIYPRYYAAGEGEPGTAKAGYEISEDARLVFFLVGPQPGLVILPSEAAPAAFPHCADLVVIGQVEGSAFLARSILLQNDGRVVQIP
ncbi:MAG: hypothetical protein L6461_08355 [Anaerolineae bacterium]|nr:hypothetical protein [Anaerolineae bacterium]